MNILFIGYWSLDDGLTSATIIPHLKILSKFPEIKKIVFCTIERSDFKTSLNLGKVKHVPLYSKKYNNVLLNKFDDFIRFPKLLIEICKTEKIDLIICRSSLAGALGYLVWKKNRIPYIVESFEPHAGYMRDSKTWRLFDLRYIIQNYFEKRQKQTALHLLPVSHNYAAKLIDEGVDETKISILPCCVSMEEFDFDYNKRINIRKTLKIPEDAIVGIYVGKYGDIYYHAEAFDLYKHAFNFFGERFNLIILSSNPLNEIVNDLELRSIPRDRVYINQVSHDLVNNYLSCADFAFSTIKPTPFRKFCSPVKNGEYWANGLPILIEEGIGDDSDIIKQEGGGVLLNLKEPNQSFKQLMLIMNKGREKLASEIQTIAYKHRRIEIVEQTYKGMISNFLY